MTACTAPIERMSVFCERGECTVSEVQGPRESEGGDEIEAVHGGEGTGFRMFCC